MIWKYWPTSKLQMSVGEHVINEVEEIFPLVDDTGKGLFFSTTKESLVRLISAFAPEDYFKNKANLEICFYYLPQKEFSKLRAAVGLNNADIGEESIAETAKKIKSSPQQYSAFCALFDLPSRFQLSRANRPPSNFLAPFPTPFEPIEISKPYKVLKEYQSDMFYRALDELKAPLARMILQMPTGSGKTRTTMEIISDHINSNNDGNNQVLWLANSKELCEQAVACFVEVWEHVGRKNVQVHRVWGNHSKPNMADQPENSHFVVGSLQTLWKTFEKDNGAFGALFANTTLLIVDEAHIAVAETYSRTVREISACSDCKILGLTATPGRTDESEVSSLSELFHNKIVQLQDPDKEWPNAIAYLRSKGVLSSVTYEPLEVTSGTTLSSAEKNKLIADFDYPESILKKIGRSQIRSAEILSRLRTYLDKGSNILLFAPSLENSKFLTSMLTFLGYKAAHVDGSTTPASRGYFIDQYINGKIQILCNYGVLATGFDAPKTDVVCIARPTKSPVLYSQMIGRGLRGSAVGGTDSCTIIEVRDTFLNQGTQDRLYEHFDDYWNLND